MIAKIDATHGLAMLRITGVTGLAPIAFAATPPAVGDEATALAAPPRGASASGWVTSAPSV